MEKDWKGLESREDHWKDVRVWSGPGELAVTRRDWEELEVLGR